MIESPKRRMKEPVLPWKLCRVNMIEAWNDRWLASERNPGKMTKWLKETSMMFGHMKCHEPSFASPQINFRNHLLLAYVLWGKCLGYASKNKSDVNTETNYTCISFIYVLHCLKYSFPSVFL
jgi:hypothetical protein